MQASLLPASIRVQGMISRGRYSLIQWNMQSFTISRSGPFIVIISVLIRPVRHGLVKNGKPLHSEHDAKKVDHQPYHPHKPLDSARLRLDYDFNRIISAIWIPAGAKCRGPRRPLRSIWKWKWKWHRQRDSQEPRAGPVEERDPLFHRLHQD